MNTFSSNEHIVGYLNTHSMTISQNKSKQKLIKNLNLLS